MIRLRICLLGLVWSMTGCFVVEDFEQDQDTGIMAEAGGVDTSTSADAGSFTDASDAGVIEVMDAGHNEVPDSGVVFPDAGPSPDSGIVVTNVGTSTVQVEWVYSNHANVYFTKTEITVKQYRACVSEGICSSQSNVLFVYDETINGRNRCNYGYPDSGRDQFPVNCIAAYTARTFCDYLDGDATTTATSASRLPTVSEWLAEVTRGDSVDYPWGDMPVASCDNCIREEQGDISGCGTGFAFPVCSRTKGNSENGLCDMVGNVAEWMADEDGVPLNHNLQSVQAMGGNARGGSFRSGTTRVDEFDRYENERMKKPFKGNYSSLRSRVGMRCVWVNGVPR